MWSCSCIRLIYNAAIVLSIRVLGITDVAEMYSNIRAIGFIIPLLEQLKPKIIAYPSINGGKQATRNQQQKIFLKISHLGWTPLGDPAQIAKMCPKYNTLKKGDL